MRYTGPVQFRLNGKNMGDDIPYATEARSFLGKMMNIFNDDPTGSHWQTTLPDGTQISAYIPSLGMMPILSITTVHPGGKEQKKKIKTRKEYLYLLLYGGKEFKWLPPSNWHNANFINKHVYKIDANSGELIEIITTLDIKGTLGADAPPGGFVVHNKDLFWANSSGHVYVSRGGTEAPILLKESFGNISGATTNGIVSVGMSSSNYTYFTSNYMDFNGNDKPPIIFSNPGIGGSSDYGTNDHGIQVYVDHDEYNSREYVALDGTKIGEHSLDVYEDYSGSASKHLWIHPDGYNVRYVNKFGYVVGSLNWGTYMLNIGAFYQIGNVSRSRIFLVDAKHGTGSLTPCYLHSFKYSAIGGSNGEITSINIDVSSQKTITLVDNFNAASFQGVINLVHDTYDWNHPLTEIIEE